MSLVLTPLRIRWTLPLRNCPRLIDPTKVACSQKNDSSTWLLAPGAVGICPQVQVEVLRGVKAMLVFRTLGEGFGMRPN